MIDDLYWSVSAGVFPADRLPETSHLPRPIDNSGAYDGDQCDGDKTEYIGCHLQSRLPIIGPLGTDTVLRESEARDRPRAPAFGPVAYGWEDEAPGDATCGGPDAGHVLQRRTRHPSVQARVPRVAARVGNVMREKPVPGAMLSGRCISCATRASLAHSSNEPCRVGALDASCWMLDTS
jgi:hypothetical protein